MTEKTKRKSKKSNKTKVRHAKEKAKAGGYGAIYETALSLDNPLDFLTSLKETDIDADGFNVSEISTGRKARESGVLDMEAINEEVNISKLVREVVEDSSLVPRDVKFDDSSLPKAKNIYEWLTQDRFSGSVMRPFTEQMITGIILFSEFCPRCSDTDWLFHNHKVDDSYATLLSKVSILENGVCPHCGGRRSQFFTEGDLNFYRELALRCGQRSGKSAMTGGMFFPYQTHKLLKMQNPNSVYGLPQNNMLHMTFCALTYAQAKETLWEFYYGVLVGSQWFQKYHALLRHYEERYGVQLLKFNDTFVQYRHRSVLAYPAGPDKRVLRGKTRAGAGIDEIGWFDNDANSKKVKTSAKEVYIALERSLLTVRASADKLLKTGYDDATHGMFMNVSSPSSQRDKICELTRNAVDSRFIYGCVRPTWEMNPTITRADLEEEFRKNHGDAMRDYGAEPPLANNPFIDSQDQVLAACKDQKRNRVRYAHDVHVTGKGENKKYYRYAYIDKSAQGTKPSILSMDAGFSNNSFACTVCVPDGGGVKVSAIVEVMPKPGMPLNYTMIYDEVMTELIKKWNVQVLLADRWNSLKILSDAETDFGIICKQYSLKYKDLWLVKTLLEQKNFVFPRPNAKIKNLDDILRYDLDNYPNCFEDKPAEHLILQLLTVQDTGTQIIKGDGLTDDIWRAAALGAWGVMSDEFAEQLNGPEAVQSKFNGALGVGRMGSGGVKGSSGGSGSGSSMPLGSMRSGRR